MLTMFKDLKRMSARFWGFLLVLSIGFFCAKELGGRLFSATEHQWTFGITWAACLLAGAIPLYYWLQGQRKQFMDSKTRELNKNALGLFPDRSLWLAVVLSLPLSYLLLGYAYLFAYALAQEKADITATVIDVVSSTAVKSCRFEMTLRSGDAQDDVCVSGIVAGPTPIVSQAVRLKGRDSFLGLFVQEVQTFRASLPPPPPDKQSCSQILLVCPT
jgi:hypothetical protein